MRPTRKHVLNYTLPIFSLCCLLYFLISIPVQQKLSLTHRLCLTTSKFLKKDYYRDELDESLAKASTKNKTVILTVVNKAYIDGDKPMLDLFLDGFWLGENTRKLIDHLLVVAVDKSSYERCMFLKLHCYKLKTDGVEFEKEQFFMSHEFMAMMWRRTLFLLDVLNYGYNFIFTDTDVIWLRNPLLKLNTNETMDLQISTDRYNGNETSEENLINTGFYMVRSNNKTIALFEEWYARKETSEGLKEQDVLENLKREGMFRGLGLKVKFLDTLYFSGLCELSDDFDALTTVHANCCRTINAKLFDLTTVTSKWRRRFRSPPSENQTSKINWTVPRACVDSWQTSSPELSPLPGPCGTGEPPAADEDTDEDTDEDEDEDEDEDKDKDKDEDGDD